MKASINIANAIVIIQITTAVIFLVITMSVDMTTDTSLAATNILLLVNAVYLVLAFIFRYTSLKISPSGISFE